MPTTMPLSPTDVTVVSRGGVHASDLVHARTKIAHVSRHVSEPILDATVKIIRYHDPALERPYVAQASLDVNGRMIRAHTAGKTAAEAIDALGERLTGQIERLKLRREADRHHPLPSKVERPSRVTVAPADRRIVRRKSFELGLSTIDEAAWDMDLLDYDFHLFIDADTGQDSIIYRGGPTGYRLAQVAPRPGWAPGTTVRLTVSEQPAAHLTLATAIEALEGSGLPFIFYTVASGRARVLYRRHDGHYGIIEPPDAP